MNSEPQSSQNLRLGNSVLAENLLRNKWVQLLEIAIVFAPVLTVLAAFRMMRPDNPMLLIGAVWIANVVMLGLIGLGINIRGESWRSIGLSFHGVNTSSIGWAILKSIPILIFAVFAFVVGAILMANLVGTADGPDLSKYNYLRGNLPMLLISLAGVYVVSSFGEEVVYRGFLITRLQSLFGGGTSTARIAALISSSIIFGLAHFEWGPTGIVQTTCMGAALGVSFLLVKRSLWPLVLAHGYLDTLLLLQLYFAPESSG